MQRASDCIYTLCVQYCSLQYLRISHFYDLKAAFGKVLLLKAYNGYGFFSMGTPQEADSICVAQTPQFLLAHHLVFIVGVLLPAETQYGAFFFLMEKNPLSFSCCCVGVVLLDDLWTCFQSGRYDHPK